MAEEIAKVIYISFALVIYIGGPILVIYDLLRRP